MKEISREFWDQCAASGGARNPFLSHAFLSALEESGSVGREVGWMPSHLEALTGDLEPLGVAPLYLKAHSRGEYVFDHGWAQACHRSGRAYYPKLQVSVPFTPVTGGRLLTRKGGEEGRETRSLLLHALAQVVQTRSLSSAHITFLPEEEWKLAGEQGWLLRMDRQFHWLNRGYRDFDDFLSELPSRKRKNLKRERRDALAAGISLEWLRGKDIQERHWDEFFRFYRDTGSRKWGSPYLKRSFFSLVGESLGDSILLILCRREGRYIAGALNFIGDEALYGRNWGCIETHPFLHFEVCYYQAIDFAIENGLSRVEAGAQGQHKLARGYVPAPTYSAHWIADPRFRAAVSEYLTWERQEVSREIAQGLDVTPFKRGHKPSP